ncbi:aminoglycoside phosphotransferase family protein [Nocardioides currus]|uniref:Aminoglycoside phosphotransferase domain-containing protein n=1 Tax=Nocardioides currus TaxID=2133958 RepID=A0A2R7YX45_9ACTN|nr:aminoglycoside phosphotransferase family protein [Nocardioides currus]PUA80913.1 hypothetical protein C7S10_10955 [Nocardioides currus]
MVHTHDVTIEGDIVSKRYVSWGKGEAEREWAGLELLARHAPGLAPTPIERRTQDGRPVVVMSRVPGTPLGADLDTAQQDAMVTALRRLFAVPVPDDLPDRADPPWSMRTDLAGLLAADHDLTACLDPALVERARASAVAWLAGASFDPPTHRVVAIGDGNLDNVLWDGQVCRLIDWEEYGASELTYELADVVEHASSRLTRALDVPALVAAFDLDDAQQARLLDHRRLLACFWLMKLLPGHGGFSRNPPGSTEDQARHLLELLD